MLGTQIGAAEVAGVKLLAVLGAMAVYVGALRLWYHKFRTEAIDKLIEDTTGPQGPRSPRLYLARRLARCVTWLRALAVLDVIIVVGALALFASTFHPFLLQRAWAGSAPANGLVVTIRVLWLGLLFFSAANVVSSLRAGRLDAAFDPAAHVTSDPDVEFEWSCYTALVFLFAFLLFLST